jgi:two-component system chemotaxis response regulator CheY
VTVARILVVDDDVVLLDLLKMHLKRHGHAVTPAADAVEALRALVEGQFDLVLTDIEMPYIDGFEFIAAIRGDEATRSVPVVVLSARQDDDSWAAAKRLRVNRYLNKPTKADQLLGVIDQVLGSARAAYRLEAGLA